MVTFRDGTETWRVVWISPYPDGPSAVLRLVKPNMEAVSSPPPTVSARATKTRIVTPVRCRWGRAICLRPHKTRSPVGTRKDPPLGVQRPGREADHSSSFTSKCELRFHSSVINEAQQMNVTDVSLWPVHTERPCCNSVYITDGTRVFCRPYSSRLFSRSSRPLTSTHCRR